MNPEIGKHEIEIADQEVIRARVIRLFSRDGTGACKRSLRARYDWLDGQWYISFYDGAHWIDPTDGSSAPMVRVPHDHSDLAMKALEFLQTLPPPPEMR